MKLFKRNLHALILLPSLLWGCASGDYRSISFSADMNPGDLAHYESRIKKQGWPDEEKVEEYMGGIPFLFLPVLLRSREGIADKVGDKEYHYHFEDAFRVLLIAVAQDATADFDRKGRSLSYDSKSSVLLGAIAFGSGHRLHNDAYTPTSSFSVLWGLFATERTDKGRSWRVFWFPIV